MDVRHLAIALLLAACATSSTSGVDGRVLAGPTCPVVRVDSPCPERPIAIALAFVDERGAIVAHQQSGDDGRFRVVLAPGRYTVRSDGGGLPFLKPVTFDVTADRYTALDLRADTGIR